MKKRKHKRVVKRLLLKFGVSDTDTVGFTSDVSPVGMFIRTNRGLPPDTCINIALEIPSGEVISLKGFVKRVIKYSSQLGSIMKNGMGIELREYNEAYLKFLKDFYETD
ncbi:MAG: PilZ domain-containing protein [Nitrospirota bacterium]